MSKVLTTYWMKGVRQGNESAVVMLDGGYHLSYLAADVDAALAERDAEIGRMKDCLIHISEYWNGNENDRAMADACTHIAEFAQQALTPKVQP